MIVNGEEGSDEFLVTSDEIKLDLVDALLAFDGGDTVEEDRLTLDNSNDFLLDDVVNVTRLIVEVDSMMAPDIDVSDNTTNPVLPRDSFIITLRDCTDGSFALTVFDPDVNANLTTSPIPFDAIATMIEETVNSLIIPDSKSCGEQSTSDCSSACKVWELGNSRTFAIFFVGQRLNTGVELWYDTSALVDFSPEIFSNMTNDILRMNSDVAYTSIDLLTIFMGHQSIVSNVRGTSAITRIVTQEGNDKFFVGGDANENITTASYIDVLYGVLDYIERDLYLEAQSGRHRLLMSDVFSDIAKGVGSRGYAKLTRASLEDLADNLGNVYFTADSGNWFDGVNLWLGDAGDQLNVTSIPAVPFNRTTTNIHAGNGSDILSINLIDTENVGSLFVANGQVSVCRLELFLVNELH